MPSSGILRRVVLAKYRHFEHSISSQLASVVSYGNAVPRSPILVSMIMEAIRSSETSVLTTATRHNNPVDGILESQHLLENWGKPRKLCGDEWYGIYRYHWYWYVYVCGLIWCSAIRYALLFWPKHNPSPVTELVPSSYHLSQSGCLMLQYNWQHLSLSPRAQSFFFITSV
jgi:hypothetical protein